MEKRNFETAEQSASTKKQPVSNLARQDMEVQMKRFFGKLRSGELRELNMSERGVIYTLIGLSAQDNRIRSAEEVLPESNRTLHKYVTGLVEKGYVSFYPEDGDKRISDRRYEVNI